MFDGRDPIYVQIADQIRQDVLRGDLQPEEQVMTEKSVTGRSAWARLFSESTSAIRVSCVVREERVEDAVGALHRAFQLDRPPAARDLAL